MSKLVRKGRRGGAERKNSGRSFKLPPLSPFRLAVLATLGVAQIAAASQIVPDGRTRTAIETAGSVTNVRTRTIRGQNGFNSFHDFRVDKGSTVNLHLPDGTKNLINLVHDSRAVVDGTLNGVLDGRIGGHVVFADPHGIVVGASGVVNVGSLLLSTPTAEFLDKLVSPSGAIDDAAVAKLLADQAPISADGVIRVDGKINAAHAIELNGLDVTVNGALAAGSPKSQRALFEATVNTDGLVEGTATEVRDGKITIVAARDAAVDGSVSVAGVAAGDTGGGIAVSAGRDVAVAAGARLDASGAQAGGDGGRIGIWADCDTGVAAGARFDAHAGATGDGGFVDVSAAHNVRLDGLAANLSGGRGGKAGTFLIDPSDVTIAADSTAYYTDGADLVIQADDSITLEAGAVINTRNIADDIFAADPTAADRPAQASTGDSGSITLTAPDIEIGQKAKLLSFASGTYKAGNITLTAVKSGQDVSGNSASIDIASGAQLDASGSLAGDVDIEATAANDVLTGPAIADAGVDVAGVIKGSVVTVKAVATATSTYLNGDDAPASIFQDDLSQWLDDGLPELLLAGNFAVTYANADADVYIAPTADIEAGATLDLIATATRHAEWFGIATNLGVLKGPISVFQPISGVAAVATGHTHVEVAAGAKLGAVSALKISATSDNSLGAYSMALTGADTGPYAISVTVAYADVDTRADVDKGAIVNSGVHNVEVDAYTLNNFGSIAGSLALGNDAKAALGVALSLTTTKTGATLGADLSGVGDVTVSATDDTEWDRNSAGSGAGVDLDLKAPVTLTKPLAQNNTFGSLISGLLGKVDDDLGERLAFLKVDTTAADNLFATASDLAFALTDHEAEAAVLAGTTVQASGDVAVLSDVYHHSVRDYAGAGTIATGYNSDGTDFTVALGLNFARHEQSSRAWIGEGAVVTGEHVGVAADTSMPIDPTWVDNWENTWKAVTTGTADSLLNSVLDTLTVASLSLGVYNTVLTGGANSGGDASKAHFAGSGNIFLTDSDTSAWIADDAAVTATGAAGSWTASAGNRERDLASALAVEATGDTESIFVTGQFATGSTAWTLSPFGTVGKASGMALGSSFSFVDNNSTTTAGVAAGAVLVAPEVGVRAHDREEIINLSPSAGKGAGVGGNGILLVSHVDNDTQAVVSNAALVKTDSLTINADEDNTVWTVAGGYTGASKSAVGAALAFNWIDTDTTASIGDDADLVYPADDGSATPKCGPDSSVACEIDVGSLDISAQTEGGIGAFGVAGAVVSQDGTGGAGPLTKPIKDRKNGIVDGALGAFGAGSLKDTVASSFGAMGVSLVAGKSLSTVGKDGLADAKNSVKTNFNKGKGQVAAQAAGNGAGASTPPKYGLDLSGSAAANLTLMDTAAIIDGATIKLGGAATVDARRNTNVLAAGGAAAVKAGGGGDRNVAAAGSLGLNALVNETDAHITDSQLSYTSVPDQPADVSVRALSGGVAGAVGLGMSLTSDAENTGTVVGSASVTVGVDTTDAAIEDSAITGSDAAGDHVEVVGYDHTDVASGGGSLYASGKAGVGGAFTFALLANQTRAHIDGAGVSGFDSVGVRAASPARVISGAAVGGFTGDESKANLAGAFVINDILDTTVATIGSDKEGNLSLIEGGDVSVASGGADDGDLDDLLDLGAYATPFDFAGAAIPAASVSLGNSDLAEDKFGGLGPLPDLALPTTGADTGAAIIGVAGLIQAGETKASLGLSAVYNGIYDDYTAEISDATIRTDGQVEVRTDNGARIIGASAGVGATTDYFAGVGSFAVNVIASSTRATLGDPDAATQSTQVTGLGSGGAGGVTVRAADSREIWSAAGNLAISGGWGAASGALAVNVATGDNRAGVAHTGIDAKTLEVAADSQRGIASLGVAGAIGDRLAFDGSLGLTVDEGSTSATIDNSSLAMTDSGPLGVAATDASVLWNAAGGFGLGIDSAAFGAAIAVNIASHDITARLANSSLEKAGAVDVDASRDGVIAGGAVGGAGGQFIAGGISAAANVLAGSVHASATGLDADYAYSPVDTLSIHASDDADVWSLGGAIAVGGELAGLGAAVTANWSNATVDAELADSKLDISGEADVGADSSGLIASLAVGMGGGESVALGGSLTFNGINNDVEAGIVDVDQIGDDNETAVHATDTSAIWSGSLAAAGSGDVFAGAAALAGNGIGTKVHAYVHGNPDDVGTARRQYRAGNLTVDASSTGDLHTIAVGASGSGTAAAAGSVVANVLTGSTTADISDAANVSAAGNVAVLASGSRQAYTFAGSLGFSLGFGAVGMSVAVNVLDDSVDAYIAGSDTRVTALGLADFDPLSVYTGEAGGDAGIDDALDDNADASFADQQAAVADALTSYSFDPATHSVRGLAVNAMSLQKTQTAGIAAAISLDPTAIVKLVGGVIAGAPSGGTALLQAWLTSGAGVALDGAVNVMQGSTSAYIDGAAINQDTYDGFEAGPAQQVDVRAASHNVVGVLGAALSGGSVAAAAGAAGVNVDDRTTEAYIHDSDLTATDAVAVVARSGETGGTLAAGLSGALLGAGLGAASVVDISGSTTRAEAYGVKVAAGDLTILAEHAATVADTGATVSLGALAGLGITVLSNNSDATTEALLGSDSAGEVTTVHVPGAVNVSAHSGTHLLDLGVGAGVGAGAGATGAAAGNVLADRTAATVRNTGFAQRASSLDIEAQAQDSLLSYIGAAGVGVFGGGGGLGVNANLLNTTATASLLDSDVQVGTLTVNADSQRTVDAITVGLGVAPGLNAGGAVGVIMVGGIDVASDAGLGDAMDDTQDQRTQASDLAESTGRVTETPVADSVPADDTVAARISGGTVTADSTAVSANGGTSIANHAGSGGLSVSLGVGGSVAYTELDTSVDAEAAADSLNTGDLTVSASTGGEQGADAYAGAAGLAALGAAVAVVQTDGTITATLGGSLDASGDVTISAADDSDLDANGYGAEVGAGAVGVVAARAERDTTVTATDSAAIGDASTDLGNDLVAGAGNARNLSILADSDGATHAMTISAVGGIGAAAQGGGAQALDNGSVTASVAPGVDALLGGTLLVRATVTPDVYAEAYGAAVSLSVAIGTTTAMATTDNDVLAIIGSNATIAAGGVTVQAQDLLPDSGSGTYAKAGAGEGGLLTGVDATVAQATDEGSVEARVDDGTLLDNINILAAPTQAFNIVIRAQRDAAPLAESTGVAAGGKLAAGASVATADSSGTETSAYFGGSNTRADLFELHAESSTDVAADAISGSGALVAGAAADAEVSDSSDTTATVGGGSVLAADTVDILARHDSRYQPSANSVQAAVVGFSGSFAKADIDTNVSAVIADAADPASHVYPVVTGYDIALVSENNVTEGSDDSQAPTRAYTAEGGAGGVLNGSASLSDINIEKHSTVTIGDGAFLYAQNWPDATAHTGLATLTMLANGNVDVDDNAYLAMGGATEFPVSNSQVDVTGATGVTVGDDAKLISADLLGISAYETHIDVGASAVTKAWGFLSGAYSTATADVDYTQNVSVGENSLLEALGNLFLTAGQRADTTGTTAQTVFNVTAYSDTYNYTVAPVDMGYDVSADLTDEANVTVGAGTNVIAGWDVTLGAVFGTRHAIGLGTGHNPYLELASTEDTTRSDLINGATALTVDGDVVAGYFHDWQFDVAPDGQTVAVLLNGKSLDPTLPAEDPAAYVSTSAGFPVNQYVATLNQDVADLGPSYQWFASMVDSGGLPDSAPLVRIHDVTATDGNIFVHGMSLDGSGILEAHGDASIAIDDPSPAWLDVANLNVIDHVGGQVILADDGPQTVGNDVAIDETGPMGTPIISVSESGGTGGSTGPEQQPGLIISGPIQNQTGLVRLDNANGDIYQTQVIQADSIQVVAPNGGFYIIAPDQTSFIGGTPWSQWASVEPQIRAKDVIAYALDDYVTSSAYNYWVSTPDQVMDCLYESCQSESRTLIGDYSIVPYNRTSPSGQAGDRDYIVFKDDHRQAEFDYVPLLATEKTADYSQSQPPSGGIQANKVLILSKVLDVNAPIIAGSTQDVTFDLDSTLQADIGSWLGNTSEERLTLDWGHLNATGWGIITTLSSLGVQTPGLPSLSEAQATGGWFLMTSQTSDLIDRTVSGYFDRASNNIVLNAVQGATGGLIAIDAQVVSTSQTGLLESRSGYGNININNTTGYGLVVNDLTTGSPDAGVIGITDRLKGQRVWYVNQGGGIRKYVTDDLTTTNWLDPGVTQVSDGLDVYQPEIGARFWWQQRYQTARSINSPDYSAGSATPWEFVDGDWNAGTTGVYDGSGAPLDYGVCAGADCQYQGNADYHWAVESTEWQQYDSAWTQKYTYHFTYDESINGWGADSHTFYWPLRASMTTRTSVRADYPIQIALTGSGSGSIDIQSNAHVSVAGRLASPGGGVSIQGHGSVDLEGTPSSLIRATNVDLSSGGSVGTQTGPLRVSIDGGALNAASTYGNIYIDSPADDLPIGTIAGAGTVSLTSEKSLLGAGNGETTTNVMGHDISLAANGGSIVGGNGMLAVQVLNNGRLDASALGNIYIYAHGDLPLGSVVSLDEDVKLYALDGRIVSATNLSTDDLASLDDLQQRWQVLGLTGDAAEAGLATAIAAQEAVVGRKYQLYWQLQQVLEAGADGSLQVSAQGQRLYSGLAAANGETVSDYVVGGFQALQSYFQDLLGTTALAPQPGFASYDATWQYIMPDARKTAFSFGAVWKAQQLENAINAAAVGDSAAGDQWFADPINVSGRNVTLQSSETLGQAVDHSFRIDGTNPITDQERVWLLTAAPGSAHIAPASGDPNALDVTVRSLSRVRVAASGELDLVGNGTADHPGQVVVGASGTARLKRAQASTDIYLGAEQDITYTEQPITIGGASDMLSLQALHGDITGYNGAPFDIGIDGTLVSAVAGGSINLKDVGGAPGLDVGVLDAQEDLVVTVPSGDLRQLQGRGYTISGGRLELEIGTGSAGTVTDGSGPYAGPLNLAMHNGDPSLLYNGTVFGTVAGDLHLASATRGVRLAGNASENLYVDGSLTLTSGGDVTVGGFASIGGDAGLQSTGSLAFAAGSRLSGNHVDLAGSELRMAGDSQLLALDGLDISVTGDALLGSLYVGGSSSPTTVTAGGSILSARNDWEVNFFMGASTVVLHAGAAIGEAGKLMMFDRNGYTEDGGVIGYYLPTGGTMTVPSL